MIGIHFREMYMICPKCGSSNTKKNGHTYRKEQKYQCNSCKYQFTEHSQPKKISAKTKEIIDQLLLEKISLGGIVRVLKVSESWLQEYVNEKYDKIPQQVLVKNKPKGPLIIQCDELWSFVGSKDNKCWIWLALDQGTREIVGCYLGTRDQCGAKGLWKSLPPVYRQCALCYTDFWSAYQLVLPSKRHRPSWGKTNLIERFNNTLRQRISRLGRKTLSFSKKFQNHLGAIWYFIHHYNASLTRKNAWQH